MGRTLGGNLGGVPVRVGAAALLALLVLLWHSAPAAAGQAGGDAPGRALPRGEIEIGKERFWLPGHGSARLVLRLRTPEGRLDPARLDAKVRAAAVAIGPVP